MDIAFLGLAVHNVSVVKWMLFPIAVFINSTIIIKFCRHNNIISFLLLAVVKKLVTFLIDLYSL